MQVNCKIHGLTEAHSNGKRNHPRCAKCSVARQIEFTRQRKLDAIAYLGGQCFNCGYSKCPAALEFHHKVPEEKDFTISGTKYRRWEAIKTELDKCVLVCANCHREIHAGMVLMVT